MKYLLMVVFILSGCGKVISDEEKNNIAERACSVAEATRKFESARRVELINDAREKLGKGPYPGAYENLDVMISIGACKSLIIDKEYSPEEEKRNIAQAAANAAAWAAQQKEEAAARAAEEKADFEAWAAQQKEEAANQ